MLGKIAASRSAMDSAADATGAAELASARAPHPPRSQSAVGARSLVLTPASAASIRDLESSGAAGLTAAPGSPAVPLSHARCVASLLPSAGAELECSRGFSGGSAETSLPGEAAPHASPTVPAAGGCSTDSAAVDAGASPPRAVEADSGGSPSAGATRSRESVESGGFQLLRSRCPPRRAVGSSLAFFPACRAEPPQLPRQQPLERRWNHHWKHIYPARRTVCSRLGGQVKTEGPIACVNRAVDYAQSLRERWTALGSLRRQTSTGDAMRTRDPRL